MALISAKVGNTGQRQRRRSGLTCLTWPQACALAGALAGLLNAGMAFAQAATPYPIKPVRFVIPFPPGGGNDLLGRAYAERLGERFGHTFIVDNRGGASTVIAAELVARAPADAKMSDTAPPKSANVVLETAMSAPDASKFALDKFDGMALHRNRS